MATVHKLHISHHSKACKFEGLALHQVSRRGETFSTGLLDGTVTLEFDDDGNWNWGLIDLRTDNGRMGNNARWDVVALDPDADEHLILCIYDALDRSWGSERVAAWVAEYLVDVEAA